MHDLLTLTDVLGLLPGFEGELAQIDVNALYAAAKVCYLESLTARYPGDLDALAAANGQLCRIASKLREALEGLRDVQRDLAEVRGFVRMGGKEAA